MNNTVALVATTGFRSVSRLIVNLILARLLFPEAFAIAGIIGSILFVIELFSDFGFQAYIVRHKEGENARFLDTIWTIKFVRGVILSLLMIALSWPISWFLEQPKIQPVILVSSIFFLISSFESLGAIISIRSNKVAKPLYIGVAAYVLATAVTITLAYSYRSYWALIAGMFTEYFLKMVFSWLLYENPARKFRIQNDYIPEFVAFAKIILPSSIITILLVQGDKAIIAKTLSLSDLGLYYIAVSIAAAAVHLVVTYPRDVLYPILAETFREKPEELREVFYLHKSYVLWGVCFLLGLACGGAYLFFDLLYDDRYTKSGLYLSILLIHPVLMTVSIGAETCLVATKRTSVALVSNMLRLAWVSSMSYIGYYYLGGIGVVIVFATVEIPPSVYLLWKLSTFQLLKPFHELLNPIFALLGYFLAYTGVQLYIH